MKFVLALVSLTVFVALVSGKNCDPLKGASSFNPDCDSAEEPYCVQTVAGVTPTFECKACVSNCDCDYDEYCSSKPGDIGDCKEFDIEGNDCRPLRGAQLSNPDFPSDWKCAITYSDSNAVNTSTNLNVDVVGTCIEGVCRYCDYRGNGGMPGCAVDSGLMTERTCVYPGKLVNTHGAAWTPGEYYENPEFVWWAIFFCFLVILLVVQVVICLITFKK